MSRHGCQFRRMGCVGVLAALCMIPLARGASGECVPETAGPDTVGWNTARSTYLGEAVGQTFYAPDTLIARITVWRPPNNLTYTGNRLFVTTVDTVNYDPPMPTTQEILQNGPTVLIPQSDPPGLPIKMDYILDPPLALPHRGTYAFFIQREGCDAGQTILLAKQPGNYRHGIHWLTGRTAFLPCHLGGAWGQEEDLDLSFEIEFCRDTLTPARAESWGRLKTIYR